MDAAREFLAWAFDDLQDDEAVNLRGIKADHDQPQIVTRDFDYAQTWARWADEQGYNVYFGIARRSRASTRGRKEDCTRTWFVWADLDGKDYEHGKSEAQTRIASFALPPTALIDSGGGYQALWRLDQPVQREDFAALEAVVAGLARFLESDPSVKDASRVFRVPGTHNHKPVYDKPLVTVVELTDHVYRLEQFAEIFPAEVVAPPVAHIAPQQGTDLGVLSDALLAIDPHAMPYGDWVRILMAVHSAFPGPEGLALAETWGDGKRGEVAQKWRGFTAGGSNVGTVFHFAKEAGWTPQKPEYGEFIWEPDRLTPDAKPPPQLDEAFRFMTLQEFFDADYPEPEWLVDDLLMAASTSLLVAKPKVGKSTLAANLAYAVAMGAPFAGRTTKPGPVCVVSLDQEPGNMRKQYMELLAGLTPPGTPLPDVRVYAKHELGYHLAPAIMAIIRQDRPALLIVDTLTKLVDIKDGNSYSEVPRALAPYSQLATETSTHICFLHHAHKGVAEGSDVTMGSVGFTGAVGTIMVMKRDLAANIITFEADQRWAAAVPETVIAFDTVTRAVTLRGDRPAVQREEAEKRITALLAAYGGITASEIKAQLAPLDEMTVGFALKDLIAAARVRQSTDRPALHHLINWATPVAPVEHLQVQIEEA